jgi:hypothetical protein
MIRSDMARIIGDQAAMINAATYAGALIIAD